MTGGLTCSTCVLLDESRPSLSFIEGVSCNLLLPKSVDVDDVDCGVEFAIYVFFFCLFLLFSCYFRMMLILNIQRRF